MEKIKRLIHNPLFRVIFTWGWMFGVGILMMPALSAIFGYGFTFSQVLSEHRYLNLFMMLIPTGLIPPLLALISRDDLKDYGLKTKNAMRSILFSILLVFVIFGLKYLILEQFIPGSPRFVLSFPWNVIYVFFGILAWGPLEVFFLVWLIVNTDRIFNNSKRLLSWGVIITASVYGLLHLPTNPNIFNTLYVFLSFFGIGLIFRYTRNIIGPMTAWTLINGQIWIIFQLLL